MKQRKKNGMNNETVAAMLKALRREAAQIRIELDSLRRDVDHAEEILVTEGSCGCGKAFTPDSPGLMLGGGAPWPVISACSACWRILGSIQPPARRITSQGHLLRPV